MKKIFLFLVIFALSFGAKAQTWTPIFGKQRFASGLGIPTKDSTYFAGAADSSLIYINPKDAGLYYKYKGYHKKVGTGTVSSVALSMPSAFSVSGSPITNNGTFIVTGAGTITQYIRGDGSLATLNTAVVPESGNLYYTDARARAAISGTSPISVTSGVVSISQASGSINGYLSATDWTTFNSKQTQLNGTGFVKQSGTTTSYDNTTYYPASNPNGYTSNTGTVTSVALTAPSAFTVTGSPVTTSGTLAIAGAGNSTQYIDGSGSLQTFPTMLSSDNLIKLVRNQSGATMTAGTIVYIDGATGNKPTIAKALATSDATSAQTYGAVQADIANNADGYIVVIGNINNLNTSGLTEGAQLYLSSTTAGTYTTTKQYAPAHLVYVGIVLRAHPTQGIIGVKIQNGYELDELHNVAAQTPSNNDGLFYESSTSLWKNKSISTVLGYTPQSQLNGTGFVKASGTTISYDNSTYLTTTSAASTYVPYTGATTDVLLGAYKLKANSVYAEGSGGIGGALQMKQYSSAAINEAGYSSIGTGTSGIFYFASATTAPNFKNFALNPSGLTDNTLRTYALPDASGTLALTSNLSSYVPYTGATSAVNIGNNVLTSGYSILNGSGLTNEAGVLSLLKGTSRAVQGNGYTNLYAEAGKVGFIDWITGNVRTFELSLASLTAGTTRVYTLPDASGTIALTSNLSAYVPYAGATGAVNLGAYDLTVNGIKVGKGGGNIADNTAVGSLALNANTTGTGNTAFGNLSLYSNTTGGSNSSFGVFALLYNTTGTSNAAFGGAALQANTTGNGNTAIGINTLQNNTTGGANTATGVQSLKANTTGIYNTASGANALGSNTTANYNTAIGNNSFLNNTTGENNTGIGNNSGVNITTGSNNTIVGAYAGTSTMSSNVILSDGAGNIRFQYNGTNTILGQSGGVGIGAAATGASLNISFSSATNDAIRLSNTNTGGNVWYMGDGSGSGGSAGDFSIAGGSSTSVKLKIAAGGAATFSSSVGVAVTAGGLGGKLDVQGDNNYYTAIFKGSTTTGQSYGPYFRAGTNSSDIAFQVKDVTETNTYFRIRGDGYIGIGTSSPSNKVDIQSSNGTTYSSTPQLRIGGGGVNNSYAQILFSDNALTDGKISFYPTVGASTTHFSISARNNESDFIITGAGNVAIGTASPFSGAKLQVKTATNINLSIQTGTTETTGVKLNAFNDAADTNIPMELNGSVMVLKTGETERMRITSGGDTQIAAGKAIYCYGTDAKSYGWTNLADGNLSFTSVQFGVKATIGAFSGVYTPLSDVNKKKDFEQSFRGLNSILGLKPTLYRYKDDANNELNKTLGFIAQEVKQFIPEAYVETGNEQNKFIGLDYNAITATLVKAIQELNQKIINLEAQIKQ